MDEKVKKYLLDIQSAIAEINMALDERFREFNVFIKDYVFRNVVERNIEIIGDSLASLGKRSSRVAGLRVNQ